MKLEKLNIDVKKDSIEVLDDIFSSMLDLSPINLKSTPSNFLILLLFFMN